MMKNNVHVREEFGWKRYEQAGLVVWFKGYLIDYRLSDLLKKTYDLTLLDTLEMCDLCNWANMLRGHFAMIALTNKYIFCIVDKYRSIPIYYTKEDRGSLISSHAHDLKEILQLSELDLNKHAVIEFSMSGYTVGSKTLYRSIFQLIAGSCLLIKNNKIEVKSYYTYSPWKIRVSSKSVFKSDLSEVTWSVMKDMTDSLDGRQVVVPLSAGNDSRLIVSLLKELNYKDVHCISYGLEGNFEAKAAQLIAEKLGYAWTFIPLSLGIQRKSFSHQLFSDYLDFTDNLANSPILIDYTAVNCVKNSGLVASDALFVNGNSGDFISGAHIGSYISKDNNFDIDLMISKYIDKHYSLWLCLKTSDNINIISSVLKSYMTKVIEENNISNNLIWAVGENIEWLGRQTKFVSATQRSYEFHGFEWRLPLWDPVIMDFWEGVPREYKINQSLYVEMLHKNNWGGVWHDIPVNRHSISSWKLMLIRNMLKSFFVLFGKDLWHAFDDKYFSYFYDNTAASAIVPYRDAFFDKCGARDRNSWMVNKYLNEKDIKIL